MIGTKHVNQEKQITQWTFLKIIGMKTMFLLVSLSWSLYYNDKTMTKINLGRMGLIPSYTLRYSLSVREFKIGSMAQ